MTEEMGTSKIWWLSLHPKWAKSVQNPTKPKKMELRKKIPKGMKEKDFIIVYTTLPVGKIEMIWQVDMLIDFGDINAPITASEEDPRALIQDLECFHQVPYSEVEHYYDNSKTLFGIQFTLVEWHLDISLSDIKQAGFTPPQGIVNGVELVKHFKLAKHLMIG